MGSVAAQEGQLRNAHSSTAIEGDQLSFEQVEALGEGRDVIAADKDKKEVLTYLEALDAVPSFSEKGKIKVEDLLDIHKMVSKDVLPETLWFCNLKPGKLNQ